MESSGAYKAKKKDGTVYYRASITYKDKHISLGSFETEKAAAAAYTLATDILRGNGTYSPDDYEPVSEKHMGNTNDSILETTTENKSLCLSREKISESPILSFDKWIMLLNLKKSGIYCKNPILMFGKYFVYYVDRNTELKFDVDDLFFYMKHKIQKRGGHLFYSDYGMQCNLLNRYGIRSFAVLNRDYRFKNGDETDFRYGNIEIINRYNGVKAVLYRGRTIYEVKIHLYGDILIGRFQSEVEAAIAYNKGADLIEEKVRRKLNDSASGQYEKNDKENDVYGSGKYIDIQDIEYYDSRIIDRFEDDMEFSNGKSDNAPKNDKSGEEQLKYRNWRRNYVEEITNKEYISIYENIKPAKSFRAFLNKM